MLLCAGVVVVAAADTAVVAGVAGVVLAGMVTMRLLFGGSFEL